MRLRFPMIGHGLGPGGRLSFRRGLPESLMMMSVRVVRMIRV